MGSNIHDSVMSWNVGDGSVHPEVERPDQAELLESAGLSEAEIAQISGNEIRQRLEKIGVFAKPRKNTEIAYRPVNG